MQQHNTGIVLDRIQGPTQEHTIGLPPGAGRGPSPDVLTRAAALKHGHAMPDHSSNHEGSITRGVVPCRCYGSWADDEAASWRWGQGACG